MVDCCQLWKADQSILFLGENNWGLGLCLSRTLPVSQLCWLKKLLCGCNTSRDQNPSEQTVWRKRTRVGLLTVECNEFRSINCVMFWDTLTAHFLTISRACTRTYYFSGHFLYTWVSIACLVYPLCFFPRLCILLEQAILFVFSLAQSHHVFLCLAPSFYNSFYVVIPSWQHPYVQHVQIVVIYLTW